MDWSSIMYGEQYGKKVLILMILDILKEHSDENNRLTQQKILKYLKERGIECDRRSVKSNVECLKNYGYDISTEDGYCLMNREFEDAELRMLIDSVLFSKNITHGQAKDLINKLVKQGTPGFSAKVTHIYNLPELHHGDNKQLMYALDTINDAISGGKKIGFTYNIYGTDFQLHPKRNLEYIVNPYQIVATNGFYYLIGNYDKYDNVSHYRLDKMTDVRMLEEKVKPKKEISDFSKGYDLPKHMAEHIYMFGGPSTRVKFLTSAEMMSELIDWFGKDFRVRKTAVEGQIEVSVKCNESAAFYWFLQYGPHVEVLEPLRLRNKVKDAVLKMAEKYS